MKFNSQILMAKIGNGQITFKPLPIFTVVEVGTRSKVDVPRGIAAGCASGCGAPGATIRRCCSKLRAHDLVYGKRRKIRLEAGSSRWLENPARQLFFFATFIFLFFYKSAGN